MGYTMQGDCNEQLTAGVGGLLYMLQGYYVSVGRSRSGELIFIGSSSAITNETYWLPAYNPKAALTRIAPRQQDIEYYLHHHPGNTLDVAARAAKALEGLQQQQQQQQQQQGWVVVHWRDPARPNSEIRVAPLHDPSQQLVSVLAGLVKKAAGSCAS
jgi:protease II